VALRVDGLVQTSVSDQAVARADDAAGLAGRLLAAAGRTAADLTGIGVTTGPGSYTGVRIGLALARGLSLVDHVPVVGMGTLALLAEAAAAADDPVCAVLDAGADKIYVAVFTRAGERFSEVVAPRVIARSELSTFLQNEGSSAAVVRSEDEAELACRPASIVVPGRARIAALANIAARSLLRGEGCSADLVLPLYVGATGARPNRNKVATAGFVDE
jgi:tRNA threonylcarbamoyladenosine biosynthesis protein TsaB